MFSPLAMINDSMTLVREAESAIALPVIVLTLVVLAHMMRMTRAAILNVMQSAYVETAELKGLSQCSTGHLPATPFQMPLRLSSTW